MAKSAYLDNAILALLFNGTSIVNLADNTVTAPLATLWLALHTADPTAAGTQASNEIAYTGYARVGVARTAGAWTVTGGAVGPVATISWPIGTAGSGTATFFSIGVATSGATAILYSGAITPAIICGAGVTPQLTTASAITET